MSETVLTMSANSWSEIVERSKSLNSRGRQDGEGKEEEEEEEGDGEEEEEEEGDGEEDETGEEGVDVLVK